ncbi:hypothetical protein EXIGLDRAFT_721663, partial [Exidia glandulosa HHB12029]
MSMLLEICFVVLYLSVSTACASTYRRAKSAGHPAPNAAEFLAYIALLTVSTTLVLWARTWEPDAFGSVSKRTFADTVLMLNTFLADGLLLYRSSIISPGCLAIGGSLYAGNIVCAFIMLHQVTRVSGSDYTTAWLALIFASNVLYASATSPSLGYAFSRLRSPYPNTIRARATSLMLWDSTTVCYLTSFISKAAFATRIRAGNDNDLVWLLFGGIAGYALTMISLRVAIGWAYDRGSMSGDGYI